MSDDNDESYRPRLYYDKYPEDEVRAVIDALDHEVERQMAAGDKRRVETLNRVKDRLEDGSDSRGEDGE